jgi:hypothetical protein
MSFQLSYWFSPFLQLHVFQIIYLWYLESNFMAEVSNQNLFRIIFEINSMKKHPYIFCQSAP